MVQLAQTTMRSELGKITLDKTFEERATLNLNIVESIRYVTFVHMLHLPLCYICSHATSAHMLHLLIAAELGLPVCGGIH